MKIVNYPRLEKIYSTLYSLGSLALLISLSPRLNWVNCSEIAVFTLYFLSAVLLMIPMPGSRTYFVFAAPLAVLSILVLKGLAPVANTAAAFFAFLYKSHTMRRVQPRIFLWYILKEAPILWAGWLVYEKSGGHDFRSFAEFHSVLIPFAVMLAVLILLDHAVENAHMAMRMGKPPWALLVPVAHEADILFIPAAVPMYLLYQSSGTLGLFFLFFPFLMILAAARSFMTQALQKQQSLDALNVATELINAGLSYPTLVDRILQRLGDIFKPASLELFMRDDRGEWKLEAFRGESPWAKEPPSREFFEEYLQTLYEGPFLAADVSKENRFTAYRRNHLLSLIFIPLFSAGENIGFVLCAHPSPLYFHQGHLELSRVLMGQISSALAGARLHEALAKTLQELKETEAQLVQSEKMAGLGKLVAGVAHELNNPLNFFLLQLPILETDLSKLRELAETYENFEGSFPKEDQQLIRELKKNLEYSALSGRIQKSLAGLREAVARSRAIVENLRTFARTESVGENWNFVDLREALDSTLMIVSALYEDRIVLHKDYQNVPKIWGNAPQINQVFMNLLANAFEAIEGEGEVWVKTALSNGRVLAAIRDSGKGIPEEIQKRIFEPFFTTKEVGKGTGLGLSLVYSVVKAHKGEISVESRPGKGTAFTLSFPLPGGEKTS